MTTARLFLAQALATARAAHVERQVQTARGLIDEADHFGHPALERCIRSDQLGLGEDLLQVVDQPLRVVAELDCAEALLRRRDQNAAERAFPDAEADGL